MNKTITILLSVIVSVVVSVAVVSVITPAPQPVPEQVGGTVMPNKYIFKNGIWVGTAEEHVFDGSTNLTLSGKITAGTTTAQTYDASIWSLTSTTVAVGGISGKPGCIIIGSSATGNEGNPVYLTATASSTLTATTTKPAYCK